MLLSRGEPQSAAVTVLRGVKHIYAVHSGRNGEYAMAYKITDECIKCGACEGGCPVSAISEGDAKFEIDAATCIECGACADGCPMGAIVKD